MRPLPATKTQRFITLLYSSTAGPSSSFTFPMAAFVKAYPRVGDMIQCPWSSTAFLVDTLYSFQESKRVFHGVLVEARDDYGWPSGSVVPLWVLDNGSKLVVWYDIQQRPRATEQLESAIEHVIGHYEADNGDVYYAIKWREYLCPTWELEETLSDKSAITSCCLGLGQNSVGSDIRKELLSFI